MDFSIFNSAFSSISKRYPSKATGKQNMFD